jgi:preprotein translocase subunit YajC
MKLQFPLINQLRTYFICKIFIIYFLILFLIRHKKRKKEDKKIYKHIKIIIL